jgi:DNA polymerase I-like protein with 3'-5' exonuclease and polymerase domains
MTRNTEIVTNSERLFDLTQEYIQAEYVAVDTETDGLKIDRQCVGISFAKSETESFYVPILVWNKELQKLESPWSWEVQGKNNFWLSTLLQAKKNLILHNAVFDIKTIDNLLGINILPQVFCDTMLLAHTVHNEEGPLGLKPLAALLIDPNANAPQDDVKESVKANGGKITKTQFEMYKCDYQILGKYACYDVMYTMGLFNKLFPKLKQNKALENLWNTEVMPLLEVSYELNTNGMKIDVPYFENLKIEVENTIAGLETSIFTTLEPHIKQYELMKLQDEVVLTPRSEAGKLLISVYGDLDNAFAGEKLETLKNWYKTKKELKSLFNLDSPKDKAYLLYEILQLPIGKATKTGRPATDAKTLEELCAQYEEESPVIKQFLARSKEIKLLSTYINPLLENQNNGYIYTGFKQCGTISGRFSSSDPINLQTLPRDDKRIKKGFIPDIGNVLIGADYSSLEPRAFSVVSGSWELQEIFRQDLDFYSKIAIDVLGLKGVSAKESDSIFLKKINPKARQDTKAFALAVPYGAGPGRISQLLGKEYQEAQEIIDQYLNTYPDLKQWMEDSEEKAIKQGYVETLTGRRRHTPLLNKIYKRTGETQFTKKYCNYLISRYGNVEGYDDGTELYLACRNLLNNAKNQQIQGLAGSIINHAKIKLLQKKKELKLGFKLILVVHDEVILECPENEKEQTAALLKECMEHNQATDMIDIPIIAEPNIAVNNLSETK